LAQCRQCGRWREVHPQLLRARDFFEEWAGEFRCCGENQMAVFIQEKDYVDFH
jgi:hypothetical protein